MLPNWLYGKSLRKLQEILNSGGQTAAGVSYSNTESGLEATNAQDAIDEIADDLDTKAAQSTVTTLSDTVATLTGTVNGKVGWSDYAQTGAVNLLPITATTQTISGITWTVNSDGSVTAGAGTAGSSGSQIQLTGALNLETGKRYRISGCPSDGATSNAYYLAIYQSGVIDEADIGEGYEFTATAEMTDVKIYAVIGIDTTITAKTFYPMLTLASYTGSYIPYAKTNKDLTEELNTKVAQSAFTTTSLKSTTVSGVYLLFSKVGNIVTISFGGTSTEDIAENTNFYELTGSLKNAVNIDMLLIGGQRMQVSLEHHAIRFSSSVSSGTLLRGTVLYVADNFDAIT